MSNIQAQIDSMHDGNVHNIESGISSGKPILIINAIISGVKHTVKTKQYIDCLKMCKNDTRVLLGQSISSLAYAGLDILNIEQYTGEDQRTKDLIDSKFNF